MSSSPPKCPRYGSENVEVVSESPIPGVWIVYGCTVCHFYWRNTEPLETLSPDIKVTSEYLASLKEVPPVPSEFRARRSQQGTA